MFEARVNSDALHKLFMLVEYLHMVFFLDIPNENSFVHTCRHNETRIGSPLEIENVLSMAHESAFGGPAQDAV